MDPSTRSVLEDELSRLLPDLDAESIRSVLLALPAASAAALSKHGAVTVPGVVEVTAVLSPAVPGREGVNPFTKQKVTFDGRAASVHFNAVVDGALEATTRESLLEAAASGGSVRGSGRTGDGWGALRHAHGVADDTPKHLRALVGTDAEARKEACHHLEHVLVDGGNCVFSATSKAAAEVASMLGDPRADRSDTPVRAPMIRFLMNVIQATSDAMRGTAFARVLTPADWSEAAASDGDRAVRACAGVAPRVAQILLAQVVWPALTAGAVGPVMHAVQITTALSKAGILGDDDRARLASALLEAASAESNPDRRAALVLAVGDLGVDVKPFFDDAALSVRVCAMLAAGLDTDRDTTLALAKLVEAHAPEVNAAFVELPPRFHANSMPLRAVITRLTNGTCSFAEIAEAGIAIVRIAHATYEQRPNRSPAYEWITVLFSASKAEGGWSGEPQRRLLAAVVENDEIWSIPASDKRSPSSMKEAFQRVGLTYDREACRALVNAGDAGA